jgi:HflK protein
MTPFLRETIVILNEMAIYLLLGFFLAGLLHVFLQRRQGVLAPLEAPGARPVFLAALIGTPLPLCSCSVLPTGVQLARRGASKGAVASFLITVPETDVVSVTLTYALIGPVMAVFRLLAAFTTGISAGLVINVFDRRKPPAASVPTEAVASGGDGAGAVAPGRESSDAVGSRLGDVGTSACFRAAEDDCCVSLPPARPRGWLAEALHYGFVEFFDDLLWRLLLGIAIGAGIAVLFPAASLTRFAGNPLLSYLVMLLVGIPLYVCASASTPIAAGLIAGGISPGAALVFLLAGPATNAASLLVLVKQFGRLVFGIYLVMIALVAVGMGLLLDLLLKLRVLPPPDPSKLVVGDSTALAWTGTLAFLGLALWSLGRRRVDRRFLVWLERRFGWRLRPRTLAWIIAAIFVLLWLFSGFFSVKAGQRAAVTRFGAITEADLGPGPHYHWPAPLGCAHRVAVGGIRRVEIGFRSGPARTASVATKASGPTSASAIPTLKPGPQDEGAVKPGQPAVHGSPTESWMLTGDENIVDVQAVAQYQVQDSPDAVRAYLFGVEDPDRLVRAAAAGALQEAVGGRGIEALLTDDRSGVERQIRDELMQPALDAWGSGIRVVGFRLVSVHAPTPVHWAFRDVAGAAEDAVNYVNQAREYAERIVREAQADSLRGVLLARGQAVERVQQAEGEASAFLDQSGEYRKSPGLTRSRLYLEKLDAVLPGMNLFLDLTGSLGQGPSIWIKRGQGYDGVPFTGGAGGGDMGTGSGSRDGGGSSAPGSGSTGSGASGSGARKGD